MNVARLEDQLILHEGLRLTPYVDTRGKMTIGIGYNVTDRGWAPLERAIMRSLDHQHPRITKEEALTACRFDIATVETAVRRIFPAYDTLDDVRQRVVMDMAYNMGYRTGSFVRTAELVRVHDFAGAADAMLQSVWATEVGPRAKRLAAMMRTGLDFVV